MLFWAIFYCCFFSILGYLIRFTRAVQKQKFSNIKSVSPGHVNWRRFKMYSKKNLPLAVAYLGGGGS